VHNGITDYSATPILPNTAWAIPWDSESIAGDLYDPVTHGFAPQTIGRHDVDVFIDIKISTAAADLLLMHQTRMFLFTYRAGESAAYQQIIDTDRCQRWYDPGTAQAYNAWMTAITLSAGLTVDHEAGNMYVIMITHDGTAAIDTVDSIVGHCSFHYYDTKTEAYPDGGE
jgi:hypothetical protein